MENVLHQAILVLCVAEVVVTRRALANIATEEDFALLTKIKEFLHADECEPHIIAALAALKEKTNATSSRNVETSPEHC